MRVRATSMMFLALPVFGSAPTFFRDVLPVLERRCQSCHRPGEIAPMALLTYQDVRPWAKAIKDAVLSRRMPPWPADPRFGRFANDPRLTDQEMATLVDWVANGSQEGERGAAPLPELVGDGWRIKPDVVITLPEFEVPAKGVVELADVTVPTGFLKDTWITSIEIRPGNRGVVHHAIVELMAHENGDEHGVWSATPQKRDRDGVAVARIKRNDRLRDMTSIQAVYVPGAPPADFREYDAAKLIPRGADLDVQMHYTPKGTSVTDRTKIGLTLARGQAAHRYITVNPTALRDAAHFRIPAGDPAWETHTEVMFKQDAALVWFLPHMHLRGKDMTYRMELPSGETETLLSVKWNFDWQLAYDAAVPIHVPKGARLKVTAHFDNSANNKWNPNPDRDVFWGDQTWEEMMVPWFGLVVAKDVDPDAVVAYPREFSSPRPR